ncbi:hypothetical protein PI126_g4723 [Phytophthora idaei]|nr:hypothetical protein PI126_g4723 [Phytophthora idaei]
MSLKDLAPLNTKHARESAARSFLKFVEDEGVTWEYLQVCMQRENAALILAAVVDKFGMYLAFKVGRNGQLLARHSVMRYYRQAKNWLLEKFPQHRAAIEKTLLTKGQVLERYCMKRESGAFVNKAPACTKKALKQMIVYIYSTAVTSADYQDAALLCLLWYLFGERPISHSFAMQTFPSAQETSFSFVLSGSRRLKNRVFRCVLMATSSPAHFLPLR